MSYSLLLTLATHCLCVLLDTAFQFAVILKITGGVGAEIDTVSVLIIQTLFFLPFIVLGTISGSLADKFSKTTLYKAYRIFELGLFIIAAGALESSDIKTLYFLIFVKGILSALNSPVKVGLIPELSNLQNLSKANGFFQMFVVFGTIFGTIVGGYLIEHNSSSILSYLSVLNLILCITISLSSAKNPDYKIRINPLPNKESLSEFKKVTPIFLSSLAIAFFWALATYYKVSIVIFAEKILNVESESSVGYLLAAVGFGMALGSILSARISFGRIEIGLVPIGSFLIAITSFLISLWISTYQGMMLLLFVQGFASGVFIVPLTSYFQSESNPKTLGTMLAIQNQISYSLIILLTILIPLIVEFLGIGIRPLFFVGGLFMLGICIFLLNYIPDMLLRFINWMLVNTFYKIQVLGKQNIPSGGALLISNHISFADAALIQARLERPVRFLMHKPIYDNKFLNPFVSKLGVIPIEAGKRENVEFSLDIAREYILAGDLVCIFPEGAISRIGVLQPFKRGMEKIMEGITEQPIIPIYLDQLWGSIFSFKGNRFIWKFPREIPYPMTITFGEALPANTTASQAYLKVEELGAEVYKQRSEISQTIPFRAVKSLRRSLFSKKISDSTGVSLNSLSFLTLTILLAENFKSRFNTKNIAIHLPNSVISASTNLALLILGKVPVNLNGTAGQESISGAFSQIKTDTLITSTKYQEKLPIETPVDVNIIYIEDTVKNFSKKLRIVSILKCLLIPSKYLIRIVNPIRADPESTATILFSSGSTGTPKGVMLSHKNIISNVGSVSQIFETDKTDTILGCLPFFHSFGYTFTLWFPLLEQLSVCYHPNPLDAGQIGKLAAKYKASILFATPTFLQLYLKKCTVEQFKTLKEVMVGAEKLSQTLANTFNEKFGVEPKEGYGCTELSPLALVNSHNYGQGKTAQRGKKSGTVGLPIPGVTVKIVDPDTLADKEIGESGLLLVKGANLMQGYLENPELTAKVIKDGWYITGDIAIRDPDGFVTITDRMSRFSKIGGEMVPHIKIEELIQEIVSTEERACVVTGIPDDKKGEKLIVLILEGIDVEEVIQGLNNHGLPNLWIPKAESFKVVSSFPLLGTGKLDLKAVKELAFR